METTTDNGLNAGDSSAFLESVRQSGLVTLDRLDEWVTSSSTPVGVIDTVARIVADGLLTGYQARQVLLGKGRRLLLKGKYRVLDELGTGGSGTVLLAEHVMMRKRVAVKVLPARRAADPLTLARFRREAAAVAALDHPNIVRAFDCDEDDGLHFLAMEYVEGADLEKLVRSRGPLPVAQAIDLIAQAAAGLHHAHAAGWVHRDVKPANLLLETTGRVKVLDLGLARVFAGDDDGLTAKHDAGAVMGTVDFMAPEQTIDSSGVDHRADVYSLGATFYFLLVGRPPFPDGNVAQKLLARQVRDPAPISGFRSDVPAHVVAVVARMMARDPAVRYSSLAEAVADLATGAPVPTAPPVSAAAATTWADVLDPTEADTAEIDTVPLPINPPRKWKRRAAVATLVAAVPVAVWLTATRDRKVVAPPPQDRPPRDPGLEVPAEVGDVAYVRHQDRVEVRVAGKPFATYAFDAKYSHPILTHIQLPSGRVVTETAPEGAGYPYSGRGPGVWYWLPNQSAVVERVSKVRLTRTGGVSLPADGTLRDTLSYTQGQRTGTTRIDETRVLGFARRPNGVLVRWSSEVVTSAASSVPAVAEANGLGLRLAKMQRFRAWEFGTPTERGHLLPRSPAPWLEAATVTDGRRWGVVVVPHPDNPVPASIGGRVENGVPEIRVMPKKPDAVAGDVAFTIAPDKPLRMRYGMFFFETAATEPIDPAAVFRDYVATE